MRASISAFAIGVATLTTLAWTPTPSAATERLQVTREITASRDHFQDIRQVTVRYGDVNLESTEGQNALYGRIKRAAAQVCGQKPSNMHLARSTKWVTCRDGAISNAVATVNHPGLTAMHRNITGETQPPAMAGLPPAK